MSPFSLELMSAVLARTGSLVEKETKMAVVWKMVFISVLSDSLSKPRRAGMTVPVAGTQTAFIFLFCQPYHLASTSCSKNVSLA